MKSAENEVKYCNCVYVIANMREAGPKGFFCSNDHSPKFGQKAVCGCEMCLQNRQKMEFKEALEMLLMLPEGAFPVHSYRYGKEDELENPFTAVCFKDNVQMHDYLRARLRCMEELIRLKREAGDFTEDTCSDSVKSANQ